MYDDLKPPGQDSRWGIFADFHVYLEQRFPKMYVWTFVSHYRVHFSDSISTLLPVSHTTLKKTAVNTYALVYHWQGSNNTLKPILLTAHQGVLLCSWRFPNDILTKNKMLSLLSR